MPATSFELLINRPYGTLKSDLKNVPRQTRQIEEQVLLHSGKLLERKDNIVGLALYSIDG